jgi:Uma2 family endonuclease
MATAIQLPLAEYLQTSYRPDREYLDGELRERNVGRWDHARGQWLLAMWFGNHERAWNIVGSTDQRMQVSPSRVRIPDLVVLRPGTQRAILTEPPLLTIEILSPDDTYSELEERCVDYQRMGVETMWIIDPQMRSGRVSLGADWHGAMRLEVPGTAIYVDLENLFLQIDAQAGDTE